MPERRRSGLAGARWPQKGDMQSFDLQGHRGARGLKPENTIPAFRAALELGVTTLEMDVVISRDRYVVVSHDPWFNPALTTLPDGTPMENSLPDGYTLFAMMYDEIRQFDCGLRRHPLFPRQEPEPAVKPLLSEVLDFAEDYCASTGRKPVRYNIETKSTPDGDDFLHPQPSTFTGLLIDVLVDRGVVSRSTIQSFDTRTLRVAHRMPGLADLSLSLLVQEAAGGDVEQQMDHLGFKAEIYSPHHRLVDDDIVAACENMGIAVLPWTVNEVGEMRRLMSLGVAGFITDYPDIGMKTYGEELAGQE